MPNGLQSFCNECRVAYNADWFQRKKANKPEWYAAAIATNKEKLLARRLKAHGLDVETYKKLTAKGCGICGGPVVGGKNRVYYTIDHDHVTGLFRGLLCADCNFGLGRFRDNPTFLTNAIQYLKDFQDRIQKGNST
jgi:hypothetical protein